MRDYCTENFFLSRFSSIKYLLGYMHLPVTSPATTSPAKKFMPHVLRTPHLCEPEISDLSPVHLQTIFHKALKVPVLVEVRAL